jgi:hypothetical protein
MISEGNTHTIPSTSKKIYSKRNVMNEMVRGNNDDNVTKSKSNIV